MAPDSRFLIAGLCALALSFATGACKKDEAKKGDDKAPTAAKPEDGAAAARPAPVADALKAPTTAPTWIAIKELGVQIEMPEGTVLKWDAEYNYAHLRLEPMMVNVSKVDKHSATFEKWNEKSKGLLEIVTSEKTDTGWVVVKKVNSEIHKKVVFETGVELAGPSGQLRCGSAAPSKDLADAVLAACKSIKAL